MIGKQDLKAKNLLNAGKMHLFKDAHTVKCLVPSVLMALRR